METKETGNPWDGLHIPKRERKGKTAKEIQHMRKVRYYNQGKPEYLKESERLTETEKTSDVL